jgi:hypothetical protein
MVDLKSQLTSPELKRDELPVPWLERNLKTSVPTAVAEGVIWECGGARAEDLAALMGKRRSRSPVEMKVMRKVL